MTWLTWRQLRLQTAAVWSAITAFALVLVLDHRHLRGLAKVDVNLYDRLTANDLRLYNAGVIVMAVIPSVIGVFWGAPLVARELEAGTHRLVWNQSVTRTRWLATKLGLTVVVAVVAVGAATLAVTWWSHHLDGAQSETQGSLPSRLTPVAFGMRGVVPVSYAVFAVVLGVAVGIVVRKTLPAMAITLVAVVFMQIATPLWIRPHLLPAAVEHASFSRDRLDGINQNGPGTPLHITLNTGHQGAWVLKNQTLDSRGKPVSALPTWFDDCLPTPPGAPGDGGSVQVHGRSNIDACLTRLTDEGYRQKIVYFPASKFWPLQWAETGLYLALSAVLAALSFRWLRRLS